MGGCHRFVQATEFGVTDGHIADTEVAIVYPSVPGVPDTDRSPFVNIDSTTVEGIKRARDMGFADAQLADVVVSPFVYETNDLFTKTAKGRLFSVFRHPIDRAVSMFYYSELVCIFDREIRSWQLYCWTDYHFGTKFASPTGSRATAPSFRTGRSSSMATVTSSRTTGTFGLFRSSVGVLSFSFGELTRSTAQSLITRQDDPAAVEPAQWGSDRGPPEDGQERGANQIHRRPNEQH